MLVLQLLRFSRDNSTGDLYKLRTRISLDESLVFGNTRYTLKTFMSHHGATMMNGHYTCVERRGDQWFEYSDDAQVTPLGGDLAAHAGHATGAYILFYEMQPTQQPLPPPTQLQPTAAAPAAARGAQPQL